MFQRAVGNLSGLPIVNRNVCGAHVLDVVSFISDVGLGRLAEIAGGAALATREQQDRAKTADED